MDFGPPIVEAGERFSDPFANQSFTDSKVTFCRIYDVDANNRTCSIKTFGNDPDVSYADFESVQWLSSYSHPDGDEVSLIPRIGAIGICMFVSNTPWIIGFFHPTSIDDDQDIEDKELEGLDPSGGSAAVNKEKINMGDYIMRSLGTSRIVMRTGGEIEVMATNSCMRTYFPIQHRISELCHNFEQTTIGGSKVWGRPKHDAEFTLSKTSYYNDVNGTDKIIEYKGTVEDGTDLISQYLMGEGQTIEGNETEVEPKPVIKENIYTDGTKEYFLRDNMYFTSIANDGEYIKALTDYAYYENIKPTGQVTLNINNKLQQVITPEGEITLVTGIEEEKNEGLPGEGGEGKFTLNVKPTGDVSLSINKKVDLTITNGGVVTIDAGPGKSTIKIDAEGNIDITSSAKVTAKAPLIDLKGDEVKLGSSVSDVVPMGKLILKAINKFIAGFNSHSHMVPQAPAGMLPSQPPLVPVQAIVGTAVLSNTVKVQG